MMQLSPAAFPFAPTDGTPDAGAGSFRWYYADRSGVDVALNAWASVGGGEPHFFQLDTGSCGVAIGRSRVAAPFDKPDPGLPYALIHYMPSGNVLAGQWTPNVPITLLNPDRPGEPAATATATVFIVDCPGEFAAGHGGMMGIGYQSASLFATNPLMNVVLDDGTDDGQQLSPGYIITPEYLEVGLTEQNQAGFGYADLQPSKLDPGTWSGPDASVTLSGGPLFPSPVTLDLPLLMDTGVRVMMLFADPGQLPAAWSGLQGSRPVHVDTKEVEISVAIPATGTPLVSYAFGGGRTAVEEPAAVLYMGNGSGVNTGLHVLLAHDYLFDGATLRMGFRPRLLADTPTGEAPPR